MVFEPVFGQAQAWDETYSFTFESFNAGRWGELIAVCGRRIDENSSLYGPPENHTLGLYIDLAAMNFRIRGVALSDTQVALLKSFMTTRQVAVPKERTLEHAFLWAVYTVDYEALEILLPKLREQYAGNQLSKSFSGKTKSTNAQTTT